MPTRQVAYIWKHRIDPTLWRIPRTANARRQSVCLELVATGVLVRLHSSPPRGQIGLGRAYDSRGEQRIGRREIRRSCGRPEELAAHDARGSLLEVDTVVLPGSHVSIRTIVGTCPMPLTDAVLCSVKHLAMGVQAAPQHGKACGHCPAGGPADEVSASSEHWPPGAADHAAQGDASAAVVSLRRQLRSCLEHVPASSPTARAMKAAGVIVRLATDECPLQYVRHWLPDANARHFSVPAILPCCCVLFTQGRGCVCSQGDGGLQLGWPSGALAGPALASPEPAFDVLQHEAATSFPTVRARLLPCQICQLGCMFEDGLASGQPPVAA